MTIMSYRIDLKDRQFGRLTVIQFAGKRRWLCRCECGTEKIFYSTNLTRDLTHSCGCLSREMTRERNAIHGYTRGYKARSEYSTWQSMIHRCHRTSWINYCDYGGRGVYVCDRWRFGENGKSGFECFIADMGDKPTLSHTIERNRSLDPYAPDNCRWATRTEQSRNRKSNRIVSYKGEPMLLTDALRASGMSETGFYGRVKKGWTDSEALETPKFGKPSTKIAAI